MKPRRHGDTEKSFTGVSPCLRASVVTFFLAAALAAVGSSTWALEPDEIALLVNSRVPTGRELAQFYAQERHLPPGRIIELDLLPGEEIPYRAYEPRVAQVVREWLTKNSLQNKVKCLVSFWGTPLRIGRRSLTAAEAAELASLQKDSRTLRNEIGEHVAALEHSAAEINPKFTPTAGDELPQLISRLQAAMNVIVPALPKISDASARNARFLQIVSEIETLLGSPRALEWMANRAVAHLAPRPPTTKQISDAQKQLAAVQNEMSEAMGYDPAREQREKVRQIATKTLGLVGEESVLTGQIETFRTQESESALDNELALLWWHGYPHDRWLPNPLNWRTRPTSRTSSPPTLMAMRIDGPTLSDARRIITDSITTEQRGLEGPFVIDARGRTDTNSYGIYDHGLRRLHNLVESKTKLKVIFDDKEALIRPHSIQEPIALYCGWYSLRNYEPPGPFATGSVAVHVASFELVSLHAPNERGWVRGLLSDGVCATLGPVAEPYLQSFPAADEFFPLLLTGKLTLAEVYWRTTPMVSWMQDCIADPLYVPFKHNPQLKVEDLPAELQKAISEPWP